MSGKYCKVPEILSTISKFVILTPGNSPDDWGKQLDELKFEN